MPDRLFRDRENAGHALAGLLDYYRDREGNASTTTSNSQWPSARMGEAIRRTV
jgi:hypothetical protein